MSGRPGLRWQGGRGTPFLRRVWLQQRGYVRAIGPARPPPFPRPPGGLWWRLALLPAPRSAQAASFCSNVSLNEAKTTQETAGHTVPGDPRP